MRQKKFFFLFYLNKSKDNASRPVLGSVLQPFLQKRLKPPFSVEFKNDIAIPPFTHLASGRAQRQLYALPLPVPILYFHLRLVLPNFSLPLLFTEPSSVRILICLIQYSAHIDVSPSYLSSYHVMNLNYLNREWIFIFSPCILIN